ncbi:ABC transporter substrate-binding protein [Actinoallomurus rhizosphaericola]|uniref:ABC transporter substrate-binding protein n=1 Tax=Actinoallomurus rhizosphaericola TaxID=2952536 RepID=UPI0020910707|nr:ABC transporter substrate-binding protein [Actinoallomurus rhizosphaericola]MCO5993413.1 ABC transporter substrate-binding protein [Actinoallomurus rhizosphaericola]
MRRFGSRPAFLTSLLLTASLAVGCGGSKSSNDDAGSGLEKKTITVASLPLVDAAGLHIAVQHKFFEAEGLKVNIKPVAQSILALPALKNGQVDVIAGGNYVTFLQANDTGQLKLRILADGAAEAPRFMELLVPKDSPIKQPKDLEGKTVAVNIPNNIQSLTFNEVLKANNVDPTKIKYVKVAFPEMGAALQKHQVDAVHTGEPFGTDIQRKQGARMVLDGGGAPVTDLPVSGYLSTQDFVTKYPKTAAAFQRALEKAQQLASSDRKQVEQVLPSYTKGIDAQAASVLSLPGYPTSSNPTRLQRLIDLMMANNMLKAKPDPKTLLYSPSSK